MKKRSAGADERAFVPERHWISEQDARRFAVGRDTHPKDRLVRIGDVTVGGPSPVVMAGPCSVDEPRLFLDTVRALARLGVRLIRANVFKYRTLPGSFQGLGEKGIPILREARERYGVRVISEVLDPRHAEALAPVADVYQVGARSMANTALLKALAKAGKPVLLKRMYAATLGEFLAAAEYLVCGGNQDILLCERGIRTFEPWVRFTLDIPGIALLRRVSSLPVIADLSHGSGRPDLALPLGRAALAAGACGLMVEVHSAPCRARSDAEQQVTPREFARLLKTWGIPSGRR